MKLKWVENKRVLKSFILLILMISTIFIINSCAFAFGGEGHFEKVDYGNKPFYSAEPVKIKSGKVIFPPNHIFDPETNKITEVKDKTFFDGILLEDGRIFHAEAILKHPLEQSNIKDGLYKILKDNGVSYTKEQHYTWDVKDKEKFFLPYLKKNPELYKEYKEALESYEKSMYGIISDPETGKYEYTKGKMNVRRNNAYKFLLDDGRVILIGGRLAYKNGYMVDSAQQIEILDPKTGMFNLVKTWNIGQATSVIKIDDNKIIIFVGLRDYYTYNPKTNTLSENKTFLKNFDFDKSNIVKLNNENILLFVKEFNKKSFDEIQNKEELLIEYENFNSGIRKWNLNIILIYDTSNNIFKYAGKINTPRGRIGDFNSVLLKDGRVLTFGGRQGEDINGHAYITNTAEVFDPKTGESKKTENMNYARFSTAKAIPLDDGRALLYRYPSYTGGIVKIDQLELYIPKGYRK